MSLFAQLAPSARSRIPAPCPRTRFNGTVSPHRVVEGRSFRLGTSATIRKRVPGATVNDVILAVCGGALRKYLEFHERAAPESLVAMAPISVRTDSEKGAAGNRVSSMAVTLFSDDADPLERLREVHAGPRRRRRLRLRSARAR